jgi:tRNA G18 (ribose-2'-O)-methylase SpoU
MKFTLTYEPSHEKTTPFRDLKQPRAAGTFIAEGEKIVPRLLASEIEITTLYLTEEHFDEKRALIEAHVQEREAEVLIAPKEEMERIVGFPLHQGILASALIPKEKTLDELITSAKPSLFIMLDEIADAENMGTLYRNSLALGATAVILDSKSVSPWHRRAVRVSMGAVLRLPTVTVDSLSDTVNFIRSKGIYTYAATLSEKAKPIWEFDMTNDTALIFGSEGYGIRKEVIQAADGEVIIPMSKVGDSLNVAVAQGMMLYEIKRQRT